jgi:hypothetical protein
VSPTEPPRDPFVAAGAEAAAIFVMVHDPPEAYAGHAGARVTISNRTNENVYVLFANGIRECYPATHFAALFRKHSAGAQ